MSMLSYCKTCMQYEGLGPHNPDCDDPWHRPEADEAREQRRATASEMWRRGVVPTSLTPDEIEFAKQTIESSHSRREGT